MRTLVFLLFLVASQAQAQFASGRSTLTSGTTATSGCTAGGVLFSSSGTVVCSDTDLTFNGTTLTATGLTVTNAPTFSALTQYRIPVAGTAGLLGDFSGLVWGASGTAGRGLDIAAGTATTDVNALSITQTWNAAGVTFKGIAYTITDTASAAGSFALRILGGAAGTTNLFSVQKSGQLWVGTSISGPTGSGSGVVGITMDNSNTLAWVNGSYLFGGGTTGAVTGAFRLSGSGTTTTLNFGGDTSAFPTLKRSSAVLQARLADDSADATINALSLDRGAAGIFQIGAATATGVQLGGSTALTLTAGAVGMPKITASATAPGASGAKLEVVCGTNAGTAKLVIAAGTSATVVTVVDNVGTGVTGC